MKAIETHYAGCRFRSRLEARWAVFFDTYRIRWEYEPQGFVCSRRLTNWGSEDTFPYLPDFWLPDYGMYAEVKGELTPPVLTKLADAVASISDNYGGPLDNNDFLFLGPVPRPGSGAVPIRMRMHKGYLTGHPWTGKKVHYKWQFEIGNDSDGVFTTPEVIETLMGQRVWRSLRGHAAKFDRGYTAARMARFEHGERG